MTQPSITCPQCQRTSYHPKDIEEGYCGNCHDWTGPSSVGHFLNLIKADPHQLPPAPAVVEASDIDQRRSEGHGCYRCGYPAFLTYAVAIRDSPESGKWWLDLCRRCGRWLHRGLDGKPLEDEWSTAVEQAGGSATE